VPICIVDDDLEASLEGVAGKVIVIGGGIEDACCEIRKHKLKDAGAFPIIDLALTTKY